MRGFQNGQGTYKSGMTSKRRFLCFFAIFWELTPITLSEMTKNLKIRACFMQNFMELDMKKFLDPKAVTCGI